MRAQWRPRRRQPARGNQRRCGRAPPSPLHALRLQIHDLRSAGGGVRAAPANQAIQRRDPVQLHTASLTMAEQEFGSPHLTNPDPELARQIAASVPGMAHWAGTGPRGKHCGECKYLTFIAVGTGKSARCGNYKMMMGAYDRGKLPIQTPACRHFEEAPRATFARNR